MAFQAQPVSPVGVQPDSGMGHENKELCVLYPPAGCAAGRQLSAGCMPNCQAPAKPGGLPARAHPPTPASQSPTQAAKRGKCQMRKPKKAISPSPNGGGTAAQIWNSPNLGGADKLLNPSIPALTAESKIECMKTSNDTPSQCKPRSNNSLPAYHSQFPSQKGIPDNTKCLGFPVQCFTLFVPPQG
ncbi:hypothetical protein DSO57_1007721 [Entomophthora muscae]|uniref:Uncharacterized protein n=1 Tax=Entomophthora muscae TaxID=34485 RepID=A0ACC2SWD8_9FUNG|nr:hypothetical protein DSO57_1007721 [Entomophthora muscae]